MKVSDKALFYQWLAGVIDGDGCFYINPKGYCVVTITMGTVDLPLLEYVRDTLGYGQVLKASGANAFRFSLTKKSNTILLVNALNG